MRRVSRRSNGIIEPVETRLMLSGGQPHRKLPSPPAGYTIKPIIEQLASSGRIHFNGTSSPQSATRSVNAVRGAYGLGTYNTSGSFSYGGIKGTGAGQTIAIVDAYDYPTIAADLAAFDAYYGLPAPPSLTRVGQTGSSSSLPGTDPAGAGNANGTWEGEEALDVQWAHAMAPLANIVLVEASSPNSLYTAVTTAQNIVGVSAVSMSWGGGEFSGETSYDMAYFQKAGVTFLNSSGDNGKASSYPTASPYVVGVGGTDLNVTGSNASGYTFASETGWNGSAGVVGSGGYISTIEPIPTYQAGNINGLSSTKRTYPDVAAIADYQYSPVGVYDSWDNGTTTPWDAVGGTSLSCPVWAGITAVVNQGRAAEGLFPLNTGATATTINPTQAATKLYQLAAADYHDITVGNNGYAAGVGYDLVTGRGSPTRALLSDLAGAATVTARVFYDSNANNVFDTGETGVSGRTLFLDLNNNGVQDALEPSGTTNASGGVLFTDQVGGGKVVLTGLTPSGFTASTPVGTNISYGAATTALFPYVPTTLSYTSANDNAVVTLRLDSTGNNEQIIAGGSVVGTAAVSGGTPIVIGLTGANQTLLIDSTYGNPVSTGGVTVTGTAAGNTTISVYGTTTGDAYTFAQTAVAFSGRTITLSNVANRVLTPGSGVNSLNAASGSVTIPAVNFGTGVTTSRWTSITVSASASAAFGTSTRHTDRYFIKTAALSDAGSIDLGGNDLVVQNGTLSTINGLVGTGFAAGGWTGTGLRSSAAAADVSHLTTLGVGMGANFPTSQTFDGYVPAAGDVLVKFTYLGDANLDGIIDGSDYSLIDVGIAFGMTGFAAGDFDYSGSIDGGDYSLIDNAFNSQTGAM